MCNCYMSKFSAKQHKEAKALCKQLKKHIKREPIGEPDVRLEYESTEIRFSLANAVYIYSQDDGWATDVVFERGKERIIVQTPNHGLLKTRDEAIQQAKAVLRLARTLETKHGLARTAANLIRLFDLCGHTFELPNGDDSTQEAVEELISTAQDIFYDDCEGDITRALENPLMLFAISALRVAGMSEVPADPQRERQRATIH